MTQPQTQYVKCKMYPLPALFQTWLVVWKAIKRFCYSPTSWTIALTSSATGNLLSFASRELKHLDSWIDTNPHSGLEGK